MLSQPPFLSPVAHRARRRIMGHILPYLFLLYIIAFLDRVNVGYAVLEMTKDLGFTAEVYGFGAGIFFIGYFLLEIPGSLLVELWSARGWIARIMISWGVLAVFMGFIHTAHPPQAAGAQDDQFFQIYRDARYCYRLVHQPLRVRIVSVDHESQICNTTHKAIHVHCIPEKITIDQSGSNAAALRRYNRQQKTSITIRHSKYLNNIVEQDQRAVKRVVRPMLGFKSFWAARCTIAGIEVMHAIRKGQLIGAQEMGRTPAEQFYTLAA